MGVHEELDNIGFPPVKLLDKLMHEMPQSPEEQIVVVSQEDAFGMAQCRPACGSNMTHIFWPGPTCTGVISQTGVDGKKKLLRVGSVGTGMVLNEVEGRVVERQSE
ncbi:Uncharacterized protein Fot_35769 [Forsythia ovata]|uniref:Uncharacterized protein n=1 Tax=Forsythia ovata TaxID=205694 RepID=A0ABD1SMH3_9LAMI